MKSVILGLVATFAIGTAAAQQPSALVRSNGEVTVQVSGSSSAQVGYRAVPSNSSIGAKAGDVVTVSEGTAKVTYGNGCSVKVEVGDLYTIRDKDPVCRAPVVASTNTKNYLMAGGAAALLLAGAAGGGGSDDRPSSP